MPAVRTLIGSGINVNVTLLFSLDAYISAAQAYINGLRDYVAGGGDAADRIASVASFFVSRVDTSVEGQLDEVATGHPPAVLDDLYGNIGIANARMAYGEFQRLFGEAEFGDLLTHGAQFQRPLWASTSVKNPNYPDTMYVDGLMGPHTVNTLPETTLTAMLEHGDLEDRLSGTAEQARELVESLEGFGISLDSITRDLLVAGVDAFADSYSGLLDRIDAKLDMFAGAKGRASLGSYANTVADAHNELRRGEFAARIWKHDTTVWAEAEGRTATRLSCPSDGWDSQPLCPSYAGRSLPWRPRSAATALLTLWFWEWGAAVSRQACFQRYSTRIPAGSAYTYWTRPIPKLWLAVQKRTSI